MKAYELLEQKGWCQRVLAKDVSGFNVRPEDKRACTFCAVGALYHCYDSDDAFNITVDLNSIHRKGLVSWNDTTGRTKQEVIDLLKKADV